MRRPLWLLLLSLTHAVPASADSPAAAVEIPLPELPPLPALEHPSPSPAAVQALDARLEQLLALHVKHPLEPRVDLGFLSSELDEESVLAIAQRLEQLRRGLDGRAATGLLERARKEGAKSLDRRRKGRKTAEKTEGGGQDAGKREPPPATSDEGTSEGDGDWLQFALALDRGDDPAWRDLVHLYGMLRMLEALGTTAAVRELVNAYSYFGELVRIDLQRTLLRLKDKAVPALIEAREHDAKKVRDWSRRTLEGMGRAIPGEAIATTDPAVLADVLLAFGRVKDIDATRVILSFVASERVHLRRAARQAVGALGDAAVWHLKDAYESVTGDKPPRAWDHRRLAQELFRVHDRSRATAVFELMAQGLELARKGSTAEAIAAYDQVLARAPLFERRKEMAPTYVAHATALESSDEHAEALVALRKALRLDLDSPDRVRIEARIAYLEGRMLADKGTPDLFILRRAVELDPNNRDARELLKTLEERTAHVERATKRYVAAGAIGLFAAMAMVWLARRRPSASSKGMTKPPSPAPAPEDSGALRHSAAIEPAHHDASRLTTVELSEGTRPSEDERPTIAEGSPSLDAAEAVAEAATSLLPEAAVEAPSSPRDPSEPASGR